MLLKNRQLEIKALSDFIQSNPDARELKRALAVQMVIQKYSYFEIRDVLQVSVGFISKYKQLFKQQGISGLTLKHRGSSGYLGKDVRLGVIEWLAQKNYWNLAELKQHVLDKYSVLFASPQSYYELFKAAGISWKKTQKCNPKLEPELVEKKTRDYKLAGDT
jgi:putative transposase